MRVRSQSRARPLIPRKLVRPRSRDSAEKDVAAICREVREQLATLIARPHPGVFRTHPRSAHVPTPVQPATTAPAKSLPLRAKARVTKRHDWPPTCDPIGRNLPPSCDPASRAAPQIRGFLFAALRTVALPFALQFGVFRSYALRFLLVETAGIEPALCSRRDSLPCRRRLTPCLWRARNHSVSAGRHNPGGPRSSGYPSQTALEARRGHPFPLISRHQVAEPRHGGNKLSPIPRRLHPDL